MKAVDLLNDLISSSGRRLDDRGIIVIRIHDSWDIRPVHGIADAWAGECARAVNRLRGTGLPGVSGRWRES